MTNEERAMVTRLRQEGLGYKKIASALSLPVQTVKSWCVRHSIQKEGFCLNCGIPVKQTPHKRQRTFCSDRCRHAWWVSHPEMRDPKTMYQHVCLYCGNQFSNDRKTAKLLLKKMLRAGEKEGKRE